MTLEPAALAGLPERLLGPIRDRAAGRIPAGIAAMRLLVESTRDGEAAEALEQAIRASDSDSAARLREALALLARNADAFATVKEVVTGMDHDALSLSAEDAVAGWARAFDRAALISPEAGVALYSLGDPELLREATADIVDWLRDAGLLGREREVVDIGCGIGRLEAALAPEVGHITGLDISAEMIALARARCRDFANVTLLRSSGRDLAPIPTGTTDLVLSVDAFPYLVQAGTDLAAAHVREAARVLRRGGSLLILNYSYRGDDEADRADVMGAAVATGMMVRASGGRPFRLWDGMVHWLMKP